MYLALPVGLRLHQFETAGKLSLADADIAPVAHYEILVVAEQRTRIAVEIVEAPAIRLDDVAHAVDAAVRHDEFERVVSRRRRRLLTLAHLHSRIPDVERIIRSAPEY